MNARRKSVASVAGIVGMLLLSGCAAAGTPSPQAAAEETHPIEGTWQVVWTVDELYEALGGDDNPYARQDAELNDGTIEIAFDDGAYDVRWVGQGDGSCPGTYELDGGRIIMTATTDPSEWDCGDGVGHLAVDAAWTVEERQLIFTEWNLSEDPAMDWFYAAILGEKPLDRVE